MTTPPLLELRFPAQSEQLSAIRARLRETLRGIGCDTATVDACVLAVDEAATNIIRHAYGPDESGDIILELERRDRKLVFRLTDFADRVNVAAVKSRPLDEVSPGGLGVHLIHSLMDQVKLSPKRDHGNCIEMVKRIEGKR